jgi:DNA-binding NarL/FixJ family response regulator
MPTRAVRCKASSLVGLIALFGTVLVGVTLSTETTEPRGGRRSLPRLGSATLGGAGPWETPAPPRDADRVRLDQEDLRLLALLAEGMPISSVARRVAMSDRTIRRRMRAICEQLGVKATVQAIVWAARRGLL